MLGCGWFLLLLLPTFAGGQKSGVLFLASDKYAYLPGLGIFFLFGAFIVWLVDHHRTLHIPLTAITGIAAVLLMARTYAQASVWTNSETLFTHVLDVDPGNPVASTNLGLLRIDQHDLPAALALFMSSIEHHPDYATAYVNAGTVLQKLGRDQEAIAMYERIAPILTERQLRGDPGLQKALEELVRRLDGWGREESSSILQRRLDSI